MQFVNGFYQENQTNNNPRNYKTKPHIIKRIIRVEVQQSLQSYRIKLGTCMVMGGGSELLFVNFHEFLIYLYEKHVILKLLV